MTTLFIGGGNMASALIGGLIARGRAASSLAVVEPVEAQRDRLATLDDLFVMAKGGGLVPHALTLITGPSRTADIELQLVIGVHGPGELCVVLC